MKMVSEAKFTKILDHLEENEHRLRRSSSNTEPFRIAHDDPVLTIPFVSSMSENQVDQFIVACLHRRCYRCLVFLGIHLDIMSRVLSRMPDLGREFWNRCLSSVSDTEKWTSVKQILLHCPECYLHCPLLCILSSMETDEDPEVFPMILERSTESEAVELKITITFVVIGGYSHLFELFVYSSNPCVRRAVRSCIGLEATRGLGVTLLSLIRESKLERSSYNACLCVACEAGLFTATVESAAQRHLVNMEIATFAVENVLQDVVEYLYSVGMMDNHIVSQLCGNEEMLKLTQQHSEPDNNQPDQQRNDNYLPGQAGDDNPSSRLTLDTARRIRQFLFYHASHPRSLETLCLLEVCRHIGWGHSKKTALDEGNLELPPLLKEKLMFKGCRELLKP